MHLHLQNFTATSYIEHQQHFKIMNIVRNTFKVGEGGGGGGEAPHTK